MGEISRSDMEKLSRLRNDFVYFAYNALRIRDKGGRTGRFGLQSLITASHHGVINGVSSSVTR